MRRPAALFFRLEVELCLDVVFGVGVGFDVGIWTTSSSWVWVGVWNWSVRSEKRFSSRGSEEDEDGGW